MDTTPKNVRQAIQYLAADKLLQLLDGQVVSVGIPRDVRLMSIWCDSEKRALALLFESHRFESVSEAGPPPIVEIVQVTDRLPTPDPEKVRRSLADFRAGKYQTTPELVEDFKQRAGQEVVVTIEESPPSENLELIDAEESH